MCCIRDFNRWSVCNIIDRTVSPQLIAGIPTTDPTYYPLNGHCHNQIIHLSTPSIRPQRPTHFSQTKPRLSRLSTRHRQHGRTGQSTTSTPSS